MSRSAPSLYSRLKKYQDTSERESLENYLTEGLCDLLNRMDRERQRAFLSTTIPTCTALQEIPRLKWKTQVSISMSAKSHYPDLIGYAKGKPVVVVEVKVGAAFTQSQKENEDGSKELLSQLQRYGQWLHAENAGSGILILLSAFTQPPADFLDEEPDEYAIKERHATTWQRVFEQLDTQEGVPLERDYKQFLEEAKVAVNNPTRKDFSILELYLDGPYERITHALKSIRAQLAREYPNSFNWGRDEKPQSLGFQYEWQNASATNWAMLPKTKDAYFHWGVKFPVDVNLQSSWASEHPQLEKSIGVFFGISADYEEDDEALKKAAPSGWSISMVDSGNCEYPVICFTPLDTILEGDNFAEECFNWLKLRFDEGLKMWDKA